MTTVEMQPKPFGHQLEFLSKSFSQDAGVTLGVDDFAPKGIGSHTKDLVNLLQRFLIHNSIPK